MLITRLYCNDIWKEEFMQTCLCILQGYRYLFVAIILNVPETQFLHCPILFCVFFIIIFCSKCLINWVKFCIVCILTNSGNTLFACRLHNFALKLMQMPKFRCIHTQITHVPKFRQMYGIREYTPPTDKLWALEMWTDFRAVSCSFQEQQQMWTYSLRVALE